MVHTYPVLLAVALLVLPAIGRAETLTGAAAQASPQADVFLDYEKAMVAGGIDAAKVWMTPAKVEELNGMVAAFGPAGFEQFRGRMRAGAQGPARRKQIEKVTVDGDHAVLEARDDKTTMTEMHLTRTKDGWKIDVRR